MRKAIQDRLSRLGRLAKFTLATLVVYLVLVWLVPASGFTTLVQLVLIVCAFWLLVRAMRSGIRKAIWSLRNRLLVTYLFIAVVPVLLIGTLALVGAWALGSEIAMYLATAELERRATALRYAAEQIARANPSEWKGYMQGMVNTYYGQEFPGIVFAARKGSTVLFWPVEVNSALPPEGWKDGSGPLSLNGSPYLWAHVVKDDSDFTVYAPLTRDFLGGLVPGILISLVKADDAPAGSGGNGLTFALGNKKNVRVADASPREPPPAHPLPPPVNRFDFNMSWATPIQLASWSTSDRKAYALLVVQTRPSVVLNLLMSQKLDQLPDLIPIAFLVIAGLFLIVELVSLVVGVSLTRTITHAVYQLYRGTQKVIEGDFSHRIPVQRNDQLGELTTSFNVMTGNVERLLAVAKEKERMQSELEIAREVQNQLYPRSVPLLRHLRLTAVCRPARMVSGDYYDYQKIDENRIAISIGDVAGKGISAALLMATLQSSIRAQMSSAVEMAATVGDGRPRSRISTARFVSELNRQLHAFTAPEKYATFCFGVYDDENGVLSYTNAGHLPPILIRDGETTELEVNGMVVGAFPFSTYEESRIELRARDILLYYTDGITEPENAYGEMFGEERLIELVAKNASLDDERILSTVIEAVQQWTGEAEQFDDMTLLLARRL